jgi:hypothetical protein
MAHLCKRWWAPDDVGSVFNVVDALSIEVASVIFQHEDREEESLDSDQRRVAIQFLGLLEARTNDYGSSESSIGAVECLKDGHHVLW